MNSEILFWFGDIDIEIYSTHKKGNGIFSETCMLILDFSIKWSLLTLSQIQILTLMWKIMKKILNLKLLITWQYQNLRIFLLDVTLNKLKIRWTYIIEDINGEKIARTFYEKELQKTNQTEFRIEKVTKKWKRLR